MRHEPQARRWICRSPRTTFAASRFRAALAGLGLPNEPTSQSAPSAGLMEILRGDAERHARQRHGVLDYSLVSVPPPQSRPERRAARAEVARQLGIDRRAATAYATWVDAAQIDTPCANLVEACSASRTRRSVRASRARQLRYAARRSRLRSAGRRRSIEPCSSRRSSHCPAADAGPGRDTRRLAVSRLAPRRSLAGGRNGSHHCHSLQFQKSALFPRAQYLPRVPRRLPPPKKGGDRTGNPDYKEISVGALPGTRLEVRKWQEASCRGAAFRIGEQDSMGGAQIRTHSDASSFTAMR